MSFNEGQEILDGRFKIQKKLGSGAFGEIYKVEKKKTGESFAAKIVSNLPKINRFLQEKATKFQKHVMLFWESKLIHKLRGKTMVPGLYYIGTDNSITD
jgi:serine/threonine protein kinase